MNQIDLNGQVAVVTGGAQGFGLASAKRFLASGAKVSLWDMDDDALKKAAELLGGNVDTQVVNITDFDGLTAAHADVEKNLGPVSILLNSAGISGKNHPLDEFPLDEWRQMVEVNLNGTFYVNKVVIPSMKAQNYGRIVNISSVAGK